MDMPQIYRPTPRRVFDFSPASADSSRPPSPPIDSSRHSSSSAMNKNLEPGSPAPNRSGSILNLTSSTLLGIYSKASEDGNTDGAQTPWGTGAMTPMHRASVDGVERPDPSRFNFDQRPRKPRTVSTRRPRPRFRRQYLPKFWQTVFLFIFGVCFGVLVTQLQQTQHISPVPIPQFARQTWSYQLLWGLLGVAVGNALPQIDIFLQDDDEEVATDGEISIQKAVKIVRSKSSKSEKGDLDQGSLAESGIGPFWLSTVRSIGAFVGIAFAVRRVPWQSTLQVSLTLAVANPVLWYLIDRSKSGFALSTAIGILGTGILLFADPDFVPVPAIHQDQSSEKFGVYTWLASILFCTSLCFGAIGRRLQL